MRAASGLHKDHSESHADSLLAAFRGQTRHRAVVSTWHTRSWGYHYDYKRLVKIWFTVKYWDHRTVPNLAWGCLPKNSSLCLTFNQLTPSLLLFFFLNPLFWPVITGQYNVVCLNEYHTVWRRMCGKCILYLASGMVPKNNT